MEEKVYSTMNTKLHQPEPQHVPDEDDAVEPSVCDPLSCAMSLCYFPASLMSCYTVDPKEEVVLLNYGKYNGTVRDPGCHWACLPGRTMYRISTKVKSVKIPETKTIDKNGTPLVISGILAYQVRNSKRAILDVENVDHFVSTQGLAALKQIICRHPYESDEEDCLKTHADTIAHELVSVLQVRVDIAGIQVLSFTFNEISYAPEIASGMLKRQQANAILQAREVIVKGAVEIARGAVLGLQEKGIVLDDKARARVVGNLLVVLCSEGAAPTSS